MSSDGSVVTLGIEDERRHAHEDQAAWQDSVVLCWWDLERSVGGYHRIGHDPNHADGPTAHLSHAVFSSDRVFKRNVSLPLRAEDQPESGGFGCGDGTVGYEFTDHPIWTFGEDAVSGELHIEDHTPAVDIYPKQGQLAERITSGHLEAGGRITGDLVLDGRSHQVDGLAFRDRGWGVRHWNEVLAHRWVAATFGPEATVLVVSVLGDSGQLADFGCVIRGDSLVYSREIDHVTYLERDGVTHRGGHIRMTLTDGEVVELHAEPLQKGVVFSMAGQFTINETMCRLTWGDRVGIGNFETSNNASAGTNVPVLGLNAFVEDGLHIV